MTFTAKLTHYALGAMAIVLAATASSFTSFASVCFLYEPDCPQELLK